MQTNGIGAPVSRPSTARAAYGLEPGRVGQSPSRTTFSTPAQPKAIERPAIADLPANAEAPSLKPPKGTDPELWKVLTADERAFFAREDAMGPLSYGHRIATTPSLPSRGGRINLRG